MNNIPKGSFSFALKASTNILNTPDNLRRWGKSKMDQYDIFGHFGNPMRGAKISPHQSLPAKSESLHQCEMDNKVER